MSGARELFELQQLDTEIGVYNGRLEKIGRDLQEHEGLTAARADLDNKEGTLRSLDDEQKSIDWDVENTRSRIANLESRMYGNQVGNPRELQSIVSEIAHLRERQSELEDRELGVMEEVDEARVAVDLQKVVVGELEAAWTEDQGYLLDERQKVETELPLLEARRRDQESGVPEASRRIYSRLRNSLGDLAVAKAERGMCTGCRITLPTHLFQRVRAGKQLTYCDCGRLLYAD
ncbi:C4-type zinc ribbon domain-containing protein [Dehalococcoidia bacterium]|nr:C4-type zinc ribbon domain-containing protein [Dehalococcoidia bacterium]